jgi:molybdenum cofactor sulfurtransferase
MPIDFAELRAREFARLDAGGHVYLDYTGSGLYAGSQVRRHAELLEGAVLGNPHSRNPSSQAATRVVDEVRERVLAFFQADPEEYEVAFVLNATGALKLVGESFPFVPGSRFALTADNHNSVHGIRAYAHAGRAEVRYVPLDEEELRVVDLEAHLRGADPAHRHLLVFPAQSNFSGVKHPLEWIPRAQALGYDVALDAAAFVPTSRLSLRDVHPDFVCISFYKMFGYPTGVGALLARRDALGRLRRPWFCGGTTRFVSARSEVCLPYGTARGFEDGTVNFLSIAAVPIGLDFMEAVGVENVNRHVMELTACLLSALRALRHSSGAPLVRLYGPWGTDGRGGTVAFNVLDTAGGVLGFREVEDRAGAAGISLRTGYFCNPGAAEFALGHAGEEVERCAGGLTPEGFALEQFSVCLGDRPVGAIRASLGVASNEADVLALVRLLERFRDRAGERGALAATA